MLAAPYLPLNHVASALPAEMELALAMEPPLAMNGDRLFLAYVLPMIANPGANEHQGMAACLACDLISTARPGSCLWPMPHVRSCCDIKRAESCRAVVLAFSTIRRGGPLSGCARGPLDMSNIYPSVENVKGFGDEVIHNRRVA